MKPAVHDALLILFKPLVKDQNDFIHVLFNLHISWSSVQSKMPQAVKSEDLFLYTASAKLSRLLSTTLIS